MSPQPARHLKLVEIDDNGEFKFLDSKELGKLQHELEELRTKFKMAQRDVAAKNLRIARMEADKARERLDYERYADVERIARYWHRKCRPEDFAKDRPRLNPMSPERFDAIRGILDQQQIVMVEVPGRKRPVREYRPMYSLEECKAAVDGAAFDHFVKQRKNGSEQHYDDLELIFRDSKHFEEFRDRSPIPPKPVAERPVTCDNFDQGSKPTASPGGNGIKEGSHGQRSSVGAASHGIVVRLEAGRSHLCGGVEARHPGQPAAL